MDSAVEWSTSLETPPVDSKVTAFPAHLAAENSDPRTARAAPLSVPMSPGHSGSFLQRVQSGRLHVVDSDVADSEVQRPCRRRRPHGPPGGWPGAPWPVPIHVLESGSPPTRPPGTPHPAPGTPHPVWIVPIHAPTSIAPGPPRSARPVGSGSVRSVDGSLTSRAAASAGEWFTPYATPRYPSSRHPPVPLIPPPVPLIPRDREALLGPLLGPAAASAGEWFTPYASRRYPSSPAWCNPHHGWLRRPPPPIRPPRPPIRPPRPPRRPDSRHRR